MHLPFVSSAILSDVLGAVWLLGLWAGAPVLGPLRTLPQRAAATLALGCAIPLALGLANVLFWWTLWIALGAVLAVRYLHPHETPGAEKPGEKPPWDLLAGFAAILALAYPAASRSTLDAGGLASQLPNAAAWIAHHGLWTAGTHAWWFPPAAELFASGLFATAGARFANCAGLMPAVLVLVTLRSCAVRHGMMPLAGTLAACALLATPVAAAQIFSLQDDLWQTSLFLCALTEFALPAFAALALTSPAGLPYAVVASASWISDRAQFLDTLVLSVGALLLWVVRDLILLPHAAVSVRSTLPSGFGAAALAAPLHALPVLAVACWKAGAAWCALALCAVASIVFSREAYLRWAAFASVLLFAFATPLLEPAFAQLPPAQSLRYALPVAALGAVWLLSLPRRAAPYVAAASGIAAVAGIAAHWRA